MSPKVWTIATAASLQMYIFLSQVSHSFYKAMGCYTLPCCSSIPHFSFIVFPQSSHFLCHSFFYTQLVKRRCTCSLSIFLTSGSLPWWMPLLFIKLSFEASLVFCQRGVPGIITDETVSSPIQRSSCLKPFAS